MGGSGSVKLILVLDCFGYYLPFYARLFDNSDQILLIAVLLLIVLDMLKLDGSECQSSGIFIIQLNRNVQGRKCLCKSLVTCMRAQKMSVTHIIITDFPGVFSSTSISTHAVFDSLILFSI
jgi:hypothetical protein